jgi:mannose-6-phosphate isomerase-like protein (cupin superfamily)
MEQAKDIKEKDPEQLKAIAVKAKMLELQELMLENRCDAPEAEHIFTPGIYSRKFEMPAGMLVIGREHKYEHLLVVLYGCAEIVSGTERIIVRGGDVFVSPPSTKRAVFAIENTGFLTTHHNPENKTDPDEIEAEHMADDGFKPEYRKSNERLIT